MKIFFKKIIILIITWQAKLVLAKYRPKIVAVTGSVGKTSTKDAIYAVLSRFFRVRKSEKSYNSEIGVPLTILGLKNAWGNPFGWTKNILEGLALILLPNRYPQWLVLEIGADRPGDIQAITDWIKPDIAVITRIGKVPVHVEFFRSIDELLLEKSFLVRGLRSGGIAVLNVDDEDAVRFRDLVQGEAILYGTAKSARVRGSRLSVSYDAAGRPAGISFKVQADEEEAKVKVAGGIGAQLMYPVLSALAVGKALMLSLSKCAEAFAEYIPPPGRMRIIAGVRDSVIIDDSYNSSPVALHEALSVLKDVKTDGRKIAVLGDMLELGVYSTDEHKKAGEAAAKVCDILVTVGVRARLIAESAHAGGLSGRHIFQFEDSRSAVNHAKKLIRKGDIILVKGSQGVRMERAVEEIMADLTQKEKLLVRQEREWTRR